VIIRTARFGFVDIDEDKVIRLPRGLMGHEYSTEFCIITENPYATVKWLQSTTEPDVAVMIADPSQLVSDYGFDLSRVEVEYLDIKGHEDVAVVNIVTECLTPREGVIDLSNPIVVNKRTLTGLQVALEDERYIEGQARVRWSDTAPAEDQERAA
jgi:flagellar assembly factor FliW